MFTYEAKMKKAEQEFYRLTDLLMNDRLTRDTFAGEVYRLIQDEELPMREMFAEKGIRII